MKLRIPALTQKDLVDLRFALECGVNYVGVSFVRTAADVLAAKAEIEKTGRKTPIIAKLEKPEAIENIDEILEVADGVMVARGDLGVEMSPERVPVLQKMVIARARDARVPVITATQMLESMTHNPRPTRAEASDVANAVFDGTDALMLSAETATGRYPVEAVKMMDRIIREAEASVTEYVRPHRRALFEPPRNHRGTDLPRFGRAVHESDCRVYGKRLDGAANLQAPASPSHHCLLAQPRDSPPGDAALGRAAAKDRTPARY